MRARRSLLISYAPTFSVSMVTPCPPSVYMLIPPISVRCNLVFVANSTLSAVWKTYSHHPPEHTRTRLSGSICVNLKSVTSCHHDSLRSSPSPWLLFARPCTRMCMCGGHISRVKLGLSSLAACLLPLWWENICWLWYEAWEYLFLSPSLALPFLLWIPQLLGSLPSRKKPCPRPPVQF